MSKRVYRSWKKVGKEVLFLATGENNPRNGEGAFIRLKNGDILHVYTAYYGDDYNDHCSADLFGVVSSDEGESWSKPFCVVKKPEGAENVMSVSLLRMQNGDIGLFFLEKYTKDGHILDRMKMLRSSDEGKSFGEPILCIDDGDYYVVNNDRAVRLNDGRILIPAALHSAFLLDREGEDHGKGKVFFFASEDDGRSFKKLGCELVSPYLDISVGLQEPGVYQLDDGRIWAWFRTNLGFQYEAFSADGAESWSEIRPNLFFSSPRSPMQVKRVGKYTVAIYNPIPAHAANPLPFGMDRTPFMLSVSEDGGRTFARSYLIEDDLRNAYCYPAVIEGEDYFLVAYYHSNGTEQFLNCGKIVKIKFDEIG